jgi:membrane fusion protein, copper/silver efflux system
MSSRNNASLALAVLVTAATLSIGLFMQHTRHGWPFSLHHGLGARAAPSEHAEHPAPTGPTRVAIEVAPDRLDRLGIRTEQVRRETLSRPVRAVATVVPDETRVSHVHARVSGWIEKLHVRATGASVRAGQPIAGIFSRELLASQTEYLAVRRGSVNSPKSAVVAGARSRLAVLGMSEEAIQAIEQRGEPRRLVTITSPRRGVVLHRGITVGTAVDPSTELVTIADLSRVWVFAEIPEADVPLVTRGTMAALEFPASGKPPIHAPIEFLYPTLSETTRTLRVRFTVDNPDGALRPGIFGHADLHITPRTVLTVGRDAVVDTGAEQHVFVVTGPGRFEPRKVELGLRLHDRVEVRAGLAVGEAVVASGVFLLDSESRLRASGGAGTGHAHGGAAPAEAPAGDHESHGAPSAHESHGGHP